MNFISHTFMHITKELKTLSNVTINITMCWLSQLRHYELIEFQGERCVNGNELNFVRASDITMKAHTYT